MVATPKNSSNINNFQIMEVKPGSRLPYIGYGPSLGGRDMPKTAGKFCSDRAQPRSGNRTPEIVWNGPWRCWSTE